MAAVARFALGVSGASTLISIILFLLMTGGLFSVPPLEGCLKSDRFPTCTTTSRTYPARSMKSKSRSSSRRTVMAVVNYEEYQRIYHELSVVAQFGEAE